MLAGSRRPAFDQADDAGSGTGVDLVIGEFPASDGIRVGIQGLPIRRHGVGSWHHFGDQGNGHFVVKALPLGPFLRWQALFVGLLQNRLEEWLAPYCGVIVLEKGGVVLGHVPANRRKYALYLPGRGAVRRANAGLPLPGCFEDDLKDLGVVAILDQALVNPVALEFGLHGGSVEEIGKTVAGCDLLQNLRLLGRQIVQESEGVVAFAIAVQCLQSSFIHLPRLPFCFEDAKVSSGHQVAIDLLGHPLARGPRHDLFLQVVEHLALGANHGAERFELFRRGHLVFERLDLRSEPDVDLGVVLQLLLQRGRDTHIRKGAGPVEELVDLGRDHVKLARRDHVAQV